MSTEKYSSPGPLLSTGFGTLSAGFHLFFVVPVWALGSAPTLPTTQHYPLGGQTTGLTIGQPNPVLPSSVQRGPWVSTRERFQQTIASQPTPLLAGRLSAGFARLSAGLGRLSVGFEKKQK